MLIGYARPVEDDKSRRKQLRFLDEAGCDHIVRDTRAPEAHPPKLAELIDELSRGDTLVVWRLDCIAHSLKELIAIAREVLARKASLTSLSEDLSITPRNGDAMLHTFGALREFQYRVIKQRTIAGLRQARARGRVGGRPRKLGPREIRKARELLTRAGMTKKEVAARFGVCRQTLNQALAESVHG